MLRTLLSWSLGASLVLSGSGRMLRISEFFGIQLSSCSLQNSSLRRFSVSSFNIPSSVTLDASSVRSWVCFSESVVNNEFTARWSESSLLFALDTDIQNIASSQYHIAVISGGGITSIFGGSLQNNVHVTVSIYHSSSVFNIVLKSNAYLTVQFLH